MRAVRERGPWRGQEDPIACPAMQVGENCIIFDSSTLHLRRDSSLASGLHLLILLALRVLGGDGNDEVKEDLRDVAEDECKEEAVKAWPVRRVGVAVDARVAI